MVLRCKPTTGQFVSLFTVAESLLTVALSPSSPTAPAPGLQSMYEGTGNGFSPLRDIWTTARRNLLTTRQQGEHARGQ